MVDPDGTVIGTWFSSPDNRSVKIDQQNRNIEVMIIAVS